MTSSLKKEIIFFSLIFILFLALRLPALHIPYHQDEYKWPEYAYNIGYAPGSVPHPPLTEFIYTELGRFVGLDNFRFIPFGFSVLDFFLLFYLAKIIFDKRRAFFVVTLFALSFYSVLASTMVDVDGAVMPFFFLLLSIGYIKFKNSEWKDYKWLILALLGAIGGFLIKVSAILPLCAIFLDFAIEKKIFSDFKKVLKYFLYAVLAGALLIGILFLSKYIFPFFKLEYSLKYWEHFADSSSFFGRGWLQTFIQFVKSILYSSPLLLAPLLFLDKEIFTKTKMFFLFIFIGLAFYLFVFDFSLGAIDRYLEFLVVPLSLSAGAVYAKYFDNFEFSKKNLWPFIFLALIIFSIQFISHGTPPLYPKTEWINRVLSLRWNFLYPFTGGSGPLPFYISFAFMAFIWISSILLFAGSKLKGISKKEIIFGILILGILYNGVFVEEYLFGKINGSTKNLVNDAVSFIRTDNAIKHVTVYNDTGGWQIQEMGKYRKRLYIDPKFDINEKISTLNQYKETYMVVDIPHIDPSTVYAKYFASCKSVWNEQSGYIRANVYDCSNAPDIKL